MRLAIALSRKNKGRFRLCAVFKKGRYMSVGINNAEKTHPLCQLMVKGELITTGIHAEIAACVRASVPLEGGTVFVARTLRRDGSVAMARPCPMCRRRMKQLGIARVYYTVGPNEFGVMELT